MTDKKSDPVKPASTGSGAGSSQAPGSADAPGGKRPNAVIDLKATEVVTKPVETTGKPSTGSTAATPTNTPASSGAAAAAASAAKSAPTATAGVNKPANTQQQAQARPATGPSGQTVQTGQTGQSRPSAPAKAASQGATGISGYLSHAVAGIAGAALTLLAATSLGPMLGLGGDTPSATADTRELTARLSALERKPTDAAASTGLAQKLAAAEERIARMEEAAKTLPALTEQQFKLVASTQALDDKITKQANNSDAAARLTRMEQQLGTIAAAANEPARTGLVPQLAQITGKLADLDTAFTTRAGVLRKELTNDVEARVATAVAASEAAKSTALRIDQETGAIKAETTRLTQRAQTVEQSIKSVTDNTGALRTAIDNLKTDLDTRMRTTAKPGDIQAAVTVVETKLSSLEQNVKGVVKSEQDRNANAERVVLSLELANLRRALDRGGKYTSELVSLKKIAGDKLNLKVLETAQNEGVPGLQVLGQEFRPLAHAMLDADAEPDGASVMDRMLSGAKSIVRVRRVDLKPEDNSAEAVIGRIELGVKEGRLGDVLDEAKRLSPKAAEPARAWLAKIEARQAIDKALGDLEAQLKTSLAGGPSGLVGGKTDLQKGTN